jgi:hypothetical protein
MVKTALTEGFDTSRLIISTTVVKDGSGYKCNGRLVQGRGMFQEEGDIDWDDRVMTMETIGDDPVVIESLALENLFQLMISKEYYLFEEEDDGSEDDIQEV